MSQALHLDSPALVKASGRLNISLDPSETLALIARTAAEITGAASCRIELLQRSGRFETGAVWGLPTRVPPDLTGYLAHLSRRVVQSGRVLLIPDVGRELEGRLPAGLVEAGCGSAIGLPLRALDRVQGILWIHFHRRRDFTDKDVALLSTFANQATIALENARLHSDLQASKGELEGAKRSLEELYRISLAIQEPLTTQERLDFILQGARELLALDRIAIFLPNAAGDALECAAAAGLPASAGAPRIPLSSAGGILSRAFAEKREFIVPDEGVPCEGLTLPALAGPEVFPSGPFVVFPLMVRGEAIGLLAADSQPSRRPLSHKIVAPLRMFANQAAITIENARLYEATVRQFKELKGLYDLGQAISSSLSLDEQLGLLVERLSQAAGAQRVLVGLGDAEDTGRLRLSLAYDASKPDPWLRQLDLSAERYPEIQEVMRTGRPLVIPEVVAEPLLAPVREGLKPLDLRSMIVMPLIVREKTIGAISLGYVGQARTFTDEQIGVLRSFATQAAIAIEKARLYEAVRQHAAELEVRVEERTRELETANQQLQDASRHKSEFLANMSHEIRTPLNSIIGFAELLREQGVGPLTERQARYLTHIWNGGKHLLQLIGDILDLSKVEAGKFILQPEPLPVAQTLEDILVIARGLANKKAQEIQVEIASDLPPLHADPVRFKQILFNLLSNAVKFTPNKGTITLRAYQKAEGREQEAGEAASLPSAECLLPSLVIEVTDTGVGIKPEDLPRLFQEFVQLETTQAQKHEGTGLGLALSKRLVELHGGRIWAASDGEGRGSTFTVVLPFAGPAA